MLIISHCPQCSTCSQFKTKNMNSRQQQKLPMYPHARKFYLLGTHIFQRAHCSGAFFFFLYQNPYSLLNYNGRSSHLHKSIPLNYVNEANHTLAIRGNAANISSFLWKGATDARHGSCLVNWRTVNRAKKLGGLGIKDLPCFNRAL